MLVTLITHYCFQSWDKDSNFELLYHQNHLKMKSHLHFRIILFGFSIMVFIARYWFFSVIISLISIDTLDFHHLSSYVNEHHKLRFLVVRFFYLVVIRLLIQGLIQIQVLVDDFNFKSNLLVTLHDLLDVNSFLIIVSSNSINQSN